MPSFKRDLTFARFNFEGFVSLERLAHAYLVAGVYPDHIGVVLAEVPDVELQRMSVHFPDFHPHGFGDVSYGDVVAEQRRAAVPLGGAPRRHDDVAAHSADLQWGRWG